MEISLELLEANYWEHFKFSKELAMYLPLKHPKRIKIDNAMAQMVEQLKELK